MITYEVRQAIQTIEKQWLHVVFRTEYERSAKMRYEELKENHPSEYFELTKVTHAEECLEYTLAKSGVSDDILL